MLPNVYFFLFMTKNLIQFHLVSVHFDTILGIKTNVFKLWKGILL